MTYEFIFYWLSWLLWIVTIFFMKKGQTRFILSGAILVTILCSNIYLSVGDHDLLLSFVILITVSGLMHTTFSKPYYYLFVSFTIMIGYTAILLWKQTSSLWLFVSEFFLIPSICFILVILIIRGLYNQLVTSILGISTGEVLHGFMLSSYYLPTTIGDLEFFVNLYMVILYLLLWRFFQMGKLQLYALTKKSIIRRKKIIDKTLQ